MTDDKAKKQKAKGKAGKSPKEKAPKERAPKEKVRKELKPRCPPSSRSSTRRSVHRS